MKTKHCFIGSALSVPGFFMLLKPAACVKITVIALALALLITGCISFFTINPVSDQKREARIVLIKTISNVAIGFAELLIPLFFKDIKVTKNAARILSLYMLIIALLSLYLASAARKNPKNRRQFLLDSLIAFISFLLIFIISSDIGMLIIRILGGILIALACLCVLFLLKNKPAKKVEPLIVDYME